jgi:hypothetical protein
VNEQRNHQPAERTAFVQSAASPAHGQRGYQEPSGVRRVETGDETEGDSALPHSELLILPDGRILVHNLTPAFADLLHHLNPDEEQITARARPFAHHAAHVASHELPD